jgi:cytochrome P450
MLSMLAEARHEDGSPMQDDEIVDELLTLLVAGHETTATALSWAFERLTRAPAALAQLEAEARGGAQRAYAEAVCRETLRLRPVLNNVLRTLQAPLEVGGVVYPKGVVLAPSIVLVHRRADSYPDPLAFRPERWLGVTPGTYTWIPFGGGVRRCIGASFALQEMEVVLGAIARAVHLEPVGDEETPVPRFITSAPSRGGMVRVAS